MGAELYEPGGAKMQSVSPLAGTVFADRAESTGRVGGSRQVVRGSKTIRRFPDICFSAEMTSHASFSARPPHSSEPLPHLILTGAIRWYGRIYAATPALTREVMLRLK
jgi:hypothetical protein